VNFQGIIFYLQFCYSCVRCIFVEYIEPSGASLAQAQMDGKSWGVNPVHVSFAIDKKAGVSTELSAPSISLPPTVGLTSASASIFISGLSPDTDVPTVKQLFARFGEIDSARLLTDKNTGIPKGVAFIDFVFPVSAAAAIDSMNNQMFNGKPIKVSYASHKSKVSSASLAGYPPFLGAYPDPYGTMTYGMPPYGGAYY